MLACSQALLAYPDVHSEMSLNPRLPSTVWRVLWGKRPELARATALVARPLPRPDRDLVLKSETRSKVLGLLVEHNELSFDEQETVAEFSSEKLAETLLAQSWVDPAIRKRIALNAGGMPLLEELAYGQLGQFDALEAADLVAKFSQWGPQDHFRERSFLVRLLLLRRPELLDLAARSDQDVLVTTAAGVLGLPEPLARVIAGLADGQNPGLDDEQLIARKFALLALVNNPSVPLSLVKEVVERVKDLPDLEQATSSLPRRTKRPDVVPSAADASGPELNWLLSRSLPSDYGPGRFADLLELLGNPHLEERDMLSVRAGLSSWLLGDPRLCAAIAEMLPDKTLLPVRDERAYREQADLRVVVFCEAAEAVLGCEPAAWETLVGLMEDFSGPREELLSVCAAL
jgi:hypothetical protein